MRLDDMRLFIAAAKATIFTSAARELEMTTRKVGYALRRLDRATRQP